MGSGLQQAYRDLIMFFIAFKQNKLLKFHTKELMLPLFFYKSCYHKPDHNVIPLTL